MYIFVYKWYGNMMWHCQTHHSGWFQGTNPNGYTGGTVAV